MAKANREDLKKHFETEDEPTEAQFAEFIDSDVNIEDDIENGTNKAIPIDADKLSLWDSVTSALNTLTWANLKAVLKTYFDTLYVRLTTNQTVAGVKTFSSFPVTPSSAPTTDYQAANKKYVDDNAGGGTEYQIYEKDFYLDAPSDANWTGQDDLDAANNEFDFNTNVAKTSSIITIGAAYLPTMRATVAVGTQTVVGFDLWNGKATFIGGVAIFKATFSDPTTIGSITLLYENNSISFTNGYFRLAAGSFASTAISDKDLIYIAFAAGTTNNIAPCYYRLKCSIN